MDVYKIVTLVNLSVSIVLYYSIIPEFVDEDQRINVSNIVSLVSASISLILNVYFIDFNYINLIYIFIFTFIIAVVISGIYWWIPTYVPKEDQNKTERYLIMGTSLLVILATIFQSSALYTGSSTVSVLSSSTIGGRRR